MTDTPISKAELTERIGSSYVALEQTIGQLSAEQMISPIDGSWSAKDLLAHIAAWQQVLLRFHIGGKPFEEVTQLNNLSYGPTPVDQINEAFYERDKALRPADVLQAFRSGHRQLLATLDSMSEADLARIYTPAGRGPDSAGTLAQWIVGDSYDHYDEHRATIQRSIGAQEAGR